MDKIYKLLRDNRQSGPYTPEELVQLGLKPFDLIWATGKTAGWMYPSEIDIFKCYVAEEKEEPATTATPVPASPSVAPATDPGEVVATQAEVKSQQAVPSSAKHIFISMPTGANPAKTAPVRKVPVTETGAPPAGEETPEQKLERKALELRQRVQALAESKKTEGEEPALDTKYSRSLDDIKEEYSHWMHEQRHKRHKLPVPKFSISPKHWLAAALVLVVAGAGFGLLQWVSRPGAARPGLADGRQETVTSIPASRPALAAPKEEAVQSVVNTDYSGRNAALLDELEQANQLIEEDLKRYKGKEKPTPVVEDHSIADIPDTYDPYEEEPSAYESQPESAAPPSNPEARTVAYRTGNKAAPLSQQIDVKAKYLWTSRGKGLSGLELALRNNSSQVLKTVAIDVFYYRDDRLLDKKTVYFNSIQPGQSFTLIAPGNKRASSATYQLGLISSDGGLYVAKQ